MAAPGPEGPARSAGGGLERPLGGLSRTAPSALVEAWGRGVPPWRTAREPAPIRARSAQRPGRGSRRALGQTVHVDPGSCATTRPAGWPPGTFWTMTRPGGSRW